MRVCKIEKQTDDHVQKYDAKQQRADIKKRISSVRCDLFIFLEQIRKPPLIKALDKPVFHFTMLRHVIQPLF